MDRSHIYFSKESANPSGAPEAGGATTRNSIFGGISVLASFLRFVARLGRDLESSEYRRLKDLEARRTGGHSSHGPGAPRRTREAGNLPDDAHISSV